MGKESSACSTTLVVTETEGLHVRPAATIAQVAGQFDADILVEHGGKQANGKSLLGICTLCAQMGAHLTVSAVGRDARRAIKAIEGAFSRLFGAVASGDLGVCALAPRSKTARSLKPGMGATQDRLDGPTMPGGPPPKDGTRRLRRAKRGRRPQVFSWPARGEQSVLLAGDFNHWVPVPLERSGETFTIVVDLGPGDHEYKFVVDGEWRTDPAGSETVPNVFGTANSMLRVQ